MYGWPVRIGIGHSFHPLRRIFETIFPFQVKRMATFTPLQPASYHHALLLRSWSTDSSPIDDSLPLADDQLVLGRLRVRNLANPGLLHGTNDRAVVLRGGERLRWHVGDFPDCRAHHCDPD